MKIEAGRIFVRLRKINGLFPVDGVYFTNRTHTITYWIINQAIIYLKTFYRNLDTVQSKTQISTFPLSEPAADHLAAAITGEIRTRKVPLRLFMLRLTMESTVLILLRFITKVAVNRRWAKQLKAFRAINLLLVQKFLLQMFIGMCWKNIAKIRSVGCKPITSIFT